MLKRAYYSFFLRWRRESDVYVCAKNVDRDGVGVAHASYCMKKAEASISEGRKKGEGSDVVRFISSITTVGSLCNMLDTGRKRMY